MRSRSRPGDVVAGKNGFKVEKHDGFGLEHTFCNDDRAGRNYHILMQIYTVLSQQSEDMV